MDGTPHLSVIIATYNGAQRLPLQLEALVKQSDAPPFEVLVVDNGSTDDVVLRALEWSDRLELRVISAPEYRGPSHARNVGVLAARASKLAFCDDDDVVGARWVAAACRYLEDVEFVSGHAIGIPAAEFTSVERVRGLVPEPEMFEPAIAAPNTGDHPILLAGNCAIRTDTFHAMRGFDRRFDPGAEDNDLSLRYLHQGRTLMYGASLTLAVRLRPSMSSQFKRTFQHGMMSLQLVTVHGLSKSSPLVNNPDFRLDVLKSLAAAVLMAFRRRRDWHSVSNRIALRSGQVAGWIKYVLCRRIPQSTLADNGFD